MAPDEVGHTFDRIEGEAQRMSTLVEDLLLLARLDQQRPIERTSVDLLAQAALDIAAARAAHPDRDITLQALPGDQVPIVTGDEHRLSQVLRNLLTNALRYSSGPVQVQVGIEAADRQAVMRVVDHGPGVPDGLKSAVFDRFFRSRRRTVPSGGGSGLGLSIVAAIVAAHDGAVRVVDTRAAAPPSRSCCRWPPSCDAVGRRPAGSALGGAVAALVLAARAARAQGVLRGPGVVPIDAVAVAAASGSSTLATACTWRETPPSAVGAEYCS